MLYFVGLFVFVFVWFVSFVCVKKLVSIDELQPLTLLSMQSFNRARATGAASAHSKHDIAVSNARNARQLVEKLNNCGDLTATGVGITNAVYNRLNERTRNSERRRIRRNETEDKAVVDRVLDQVLDFSSSSYFSSSSSSSSSYSSL